MNDKLLMETAVLAGEIMLVSGAEIYRVEDTINRILRRAGRKTAETIVISTGIFATLNDPEIEAITVVRRVADRSTNLNRVYLVNDVSRRLCNESLSAEQAYSELLEIQKVVQYRPLLKHAGLISVSVFFVLLLGGKAADCAAAALTGGVLAAVTHAVNYIRLNDFCRNAVCSFAIANATLCFREWLLPSLNMNMVIIGAIMPLVPGVIFTTAIRDTLNGDYSAGMARMLEAVVVALAVAAGVGSGISVFNYIYGGALL